MSLRAIFLYCLLLSCCITSATADSIVYGGAQSPISLKPFFRVIEEKDVSYTAASLFSTPELFSPISKLKPGKPDNVFWLYTRLHSKEDADAVISFLHLTHADLYILPDTPHAMITHRKAGAFRPSEQINADDGRFNFLLKLSAGITYKLLIRSQHTKQYRPILDFELSDLHYYNRARQKREVIDHLFQGAEVLLLLYVMICWMITRYRPYIWLAIFITGLTLYSLALGRYLIDWFLPHHPSLGWGLTIHFLQLAVAALFLLVLDFWKLKERDLRLFRWGRIILYAGGLLALLSFIIHYYTSNFRIMSGINGLGLLIQAAYLLHTLKLWKVFDKQERFLGYGIMVYLLISATGTFSMFLFGEKAYTLFAILSGSITISVSLLFLTGITGKLWQNEKDKIFYLSELNRLQLHQNQLLEKSVNERTRELHQRNEYIELLMNELNHRVKNNLQLLYSLNQLQLSDDKEVYSGDMVKENISRIKAMILVNERLNAGNSTANTTISPASFIADIAEHARSIFNRHAPIDFKIHTDDKLQLDATAGLCLGLIVTELITNSCKHAFAMQMNPRIDISISTSGDHWEMNYHDNGSGTNASSGNSFGLNLIADLTRQLKGVFTLSRDNGTHYSFKFPVQS